MTFPRVFLLIACLPIFSTRIALAAGTCECPDIADLRNREAEERAAIQAYRDAIARWGSSAPAANEVSREEFQRNEVQPFINKVTTEGSNRARGGTDPSCRTTIDESTACMKEVAAQHEHTHATACHAHNSQTVLSSARWSTLADYANEEIASYQSEASFVHAALSELSSKCKLRIEMTSEIRAGQETTLSKATAKVTAMFMAPDGQPATPYQGVGSLQYQTKDVGPPKLVGDPMLVKLAPVCYAASEGSGKTPFNVIDGYLWRTATPPYEPQLDLAFEIFPTSETRMLKGSRQCPKGKSAQPFWSYWFVVGKSVTTAANHILVDGWTFAPRGGIYAEKVIHGTCGKTVPMPGPFAGMGPLALCAETTTFSIRLDR